MRSFIKKYFNEVIFALVILVCLSFVLNIVILERDYSEKMYTQSLSRAEYYSRAQKEKVNAEIEGIRNDAVLFAAGVSRCETEEDFRHELSNYRISTDSNPYYKDLFYFQNGSLFSKNMTQDESYAEIVALSGATEVTLSRVFQFRRSLMSVAVVAPVENSPFAEKIVLV